MAEHETAQAQAQAQALFVECVGGLEGSMDVQQLQLVLGRIGRTFNHEEAAALLVQLDRNQDGLVTLDDFCAAMNDFAATFGGPGGGTADDGPDSEIELPSSSEQGHAAVTGIGDEGEGLSEDGEGDGDVGSAVDGGGGGADALATGNASMGSDRGEEEDVVGDGLDTEHRRRRRNSRRTRKESGRFGLARQTSEEGEGEGGEREVREYIATSLRDVTGISGEELRDVMALVDDLVAAECVDYEAAIDEVKAALDQATESKRKVEQRLQELSEEFGQQDAELNAAASYRRLCDERQQQINEMQLESAKLRDEIAGLLASEQAAKAVVAERNRLRTTVDSQKQQLLDQLEKQRSVEASHSSSVRDFELIQEERDSLLQEFHCVLEQVKDQGVNVEFQAQESSEQNIKLREEVRRLQATLASKEAAVERYKSQLDDQTLLVQSLHAERTASGEQSGYTGSLMNEIELMMMTQIGDDSGNGGGEAEAEGGIDAVGGEPPSPAKAAPQLASGGEDSANAGSPFPNTSATPTKAERVPNEPAENMPTSQPSSPSRQQKGHAYILQDRLQVYAAASANHLSGRKVITPQMAAEMDIPSLQKTAAALQDLIDTRSSRLINALEERSWLDNDIQMKNGIVRLLVQRAAADASPRTSSSKATPSPRQRSSDGPASTPRRTNSGAGRSSLGGAMSAFGSSIISTPKAMASRLKFWGSSTPARPSSPSSTASAGGTPPKMGKTGSPTPKDEAPG